MNVSVINSLVEGFLEKAASIFVETSLIRVLKARAYQIGKANVLIRAASKGRTNRYGACQDV